MRVRFFIALLSLGCTGGDVTGFQGSSGTSMAWSARSDTVRVSNLTSHDVRFSLIGRTWMHNALIDWCFGFGQCGTSLPGKATISVPYDQIDGAAAPEKEAMLVWWTPSGTGSVPFDTVVVRIR